MTITLTADEIFDLRDAMADFARELDNFRIVNSTQIPAIIFSELEEWSRLIKKRVFDLTGIALQQVKTDLEKPAQEIKKAIKKLKNALKTIDTFNKVIDAIADLITIFGTVARSAATGLGTAGIGSALGSINNIVGLVV